MDVLAPARGGSGSGDSGRMAEKCGLYVVPRDTVHISDGVVTINGATLEEPYIAQNPLYFGEWTVPEGNLFVLGDNRNDSRDSHQWGLLPLENVIGKSLYEFILPEYHTIARDCINCVFQTGSSSSYISQATGPDNTIAWYQNSLSAVEENGKIVGVGFFATDITKQKQAEEHLKKIGKDLENLVARQTVSLVRE